MFDQFQHFFIFLCPREMLDHAAPLSYIPQKSGKYDKLDNKLAFTRRLSKRTKKISNRNVKLLCIVNPSINSIIHSQYNQDLPFEDGVPLGT